MRRDLPFVVIIDDDQSFREALESLLGSFGLKTISFDSAISFLNSAESLKACCLIVDVNMPLMTGLELQDHLAVIKPDLPMIFVSGAALPSVSSRAMGAGAAAFFKKPLASNTLYAAILAACGAELFP